MTWKWVCSTRKSRYIQRTDSKAINPIAYHTEDAWKEFLLSVYCGIAWLWKDGERQEVMMWMCANTDLSFQKEFLTLENKARTHPSKSFRQVFEVSPRRDRSSVHLYRKEPCCQLTWGSAQLCRLCYKHPIPFAGEQWRGQGASREW